MGFTTAFLYAALCKTCTTLSAALLAQKHYRSCGAKGRAGTSRSPFTPQITNDRFGSRGRAVTLLYSTACGGCGTLSMEQHKVSDPFVGCIPIDVLNTLLLASLQHVSAHVTLFVLSSQHLADKLVDRPQLKRFLAVAEVGLPFARGLGSSAGTMTRFSFAAFSKISASSAA